MSNIVDLPGGVPEAANPILDHRILRILCRILTALFLSFVVFQIVWVVAAAVGITLFADHIRVGASGAYVYSGTPPAMPGTVLFSDQSPVTRFAGFVDIVIATLPILLAFWNLRALFALYARGVVFARENAQILKRVGLCLVIYPFAKVFANIVFRAAGGTDKAWFHMELVYALVCGLIVFVIAKVMEFGREIEQEKDSFV